ncbi:MAG: 1-deoxy-D-xylulose-5-phosphate synthase [Armatimonas sp.]
MSDYPLLDAQRGPEDLKNLDNEKLLQLAQELRGGFIETIAGCGGHFGPNLGVIELTLALYTAFDIPRDRVIWDVGHQCYPHKMLTGRWPQLGTIKQYGGISGYLRREESEYDLFGAGHASTSLSAALGFAKARDIKGTKEHVVGVIGDGSLTGGMALEALLNVGDTDVTFLLNDNTMSIAENVGALSTYLAKLRLMPLYQQVETKVKKTLPKDGLLYRAAAGAKHAATHFAGPANTGLFFEELGFQYIGPIDGHDLPLLIQVFEHVKALKGPVLLHVLTQKGKGYAPAEGDPRTWHATTGFNIEDGKMEKKSSGISYSQAFAESLIEAAERDPKLVAITAAMPDGTGLNKFQPKFPDRFFDVGIAEQHGVTFAAGLAAAGMTPVCTIYSTFLQRAYDQIVHDVCIQNLPVVFCMDRGGLVGDDGATHHGVFDIAYLRQIPNMVHCSPKDTVELRAMVSFATRYKAGPIAVRYPRGSGPILGEEPTPIELGMSETLKQGKDVAIIAYGQMVATALEAAKHLEQVHGVSAEVINARWAKPLDGNMLRDVVTRIGKIVTVEDGVLAGGFGSGVLEFFEENNLYPAIKRVGIGDHFVEHGTIPILHSLNGMDALGIVKAAGQVLGRNLDPKAVSAPSTK